MSLIVADRVQETTNTTGTGAYTLGGVVAGFRTFASVASNADTVYYAITDNTNYEVGLGTYASSGGTIARTTIFASSNSNNAVNWGSGTKNIFLTYPADKAVIEDASNNVTIGNNLVVGGTVDGVDIAARDAVLTSTTTTANAALPKAGGAMTGAITTNSTFDGRDVATDGTKLDGIEASADVTDTANVASAGALMDSELTNLAAVKAINQSLVTSASPTFAGLTAGGNIAVTGTVDGRDVASDGTKLDTVETNADVTDTANVTAAGALMDSEVDADIKTLVLPASTTISAYGKTIVDDANASAARTTLGVAIGSNVQAYSSVLENTTASFLTADETKLDYITVTQAVSLDQMETDIAALENGMVYKGDWNAGSGSFPGGGSAQTGWFYYVSGAGTVNGIAFAVGDNIVATTDNASTSTYASNWSKHDQTDAVQAVVGLTGSIAKGSLLSALNVEDGADVTDTANVTSAGALMDSEVDADIKTLVLPANTTITAYGRTLVDDADASTARTTLGLGTAATTAASAYATAAQGTKADAALPKAGGAMTGAITTNSTFDGRDVATDGAKLDNIEANADVTDATNVTSAGALMDSEVTNLAQVKAFDSSDYATAAQGTKADAALPKAGGAITGNVTWGDSNKAIFGAGSDLQIYTNGTDSFIDETSAGWLYIRGNNTVIGKYTGETYIKGIADGAVEIYHNNVKKIETTASGVSVAGNIAVSGTVDGRDVATDGTKLDGIEASADVTDTANVTAAGALMDSEVDADIKTLVLPANTTISTFGRTLIDDAAASNARTTLGLGTAATTAATAYATAAQGTLATNALPKAGGAMTGAITTNSTFDGRDVATDGTKLDGIEASADVTDTANVTAAGALMDSEVDADIKTLVLPASTTISAYGKTLVDDADAATARTTLGLGTAATTAASAYATAAQGATADAALPKAGGTMTGNATFGDNNKVIFGAGSDMELFHDGSNSHIRDNGTGNLFLRGGGQIALRSPAEENMVVAIGNGAVELYYDNSKKLDTASTGISVTGNVTVSGTVDGRDVATDGSKLDGIEASADVTDTANVTAAGALMDSELTNLAAVKAINQSLVTGASPTFAGLTVAGNIAVTGNVDGRDIATNIPSSLGTAGQVLTVNAGASAGEWADAGGGANDGIFFENGQNVTSNYTITNGKNAMSAGPITINSGVTVTVGDGETWTVV